MFWKCEDIPFAGGATYCISMWAVSEAKIRLW